MHFVDGNRLATVVDIRPMLSVGVVFPVLHQFRCRHRCVLWTHLAASCIGIGLEGLQIAVLADDLVLVGDAGPDVRGKDFPDAAVAAQPHDVAAAVPAVEFADDGNPARIGGPDSEMEAVDAFML